MKLINIKIILFLYLTKHILSYLAIPFKTYYSTNDNENLSALEFLQNYYYNKIYFPIEVGIPSKEVPFILTTASSGLNIGYFCSRFNFSNLPEKYYEYSVENSKTYNITTQGLKIISNTFMGSPSTESYNFFTNIEKNEDNKLKINNIPFVYNSKTDLYQYIENELICGLIGIPLFDKENFQGNFNLINTLYNLNITDNYTLTYEYDENDNNDGMLIIGEEPFNYNPNKYRKEQIRNDYSIGEHNELVWGTLFNSIYFYDKDNNKISIKDIKYARFIPELNCIIGTQSYYRIIKEKFFDFYINKTICNMELVPLKTYDSKMKNYYIFSCGSNNSDFQVEKFPTLYFKHVKFNYTFELDYKDLFIIKGNKVFFMIFFPYSYIEHFEFGKIFLKKYFFSYDIDKKNIYFYNNNISIDENIVDNNKEKNKIVLYVLISLGIIFCLISCIIGFYFGKKLYEKNKRDKRKNEIDEDYDYSLNNNN